MKTTIYVLFIFLLTGFFSVSYSQNPDSLGEIKVDSAMIRIRELKKILQDREKQRVKDSLKKDELISSLELIKATDLIKRNELEKQIKQIEQKDSINKANQKEKINALKVKAKGYPVKPFSDTLFMIYTKLGPIRPDERAINISYKIRT